MLLEEEEEEKALSQKTESNKRTWPTESEGGFNTYLDVDVGVHVC